MSDNIPYDQIDHELSILREGVDRIINDASARRRRNPDSKLLFTMFDRLIGPIKRRYTQAKEFYQNARREGRDNVRKVTHWKPYLRDEYPSFTDAQIEVLKKQIDTYPRRESSRRDKAKARAKAKSDIRRVLNITVQGSLGTALTVEVALRPQRRKTLDQLIFDYPLMDYKEEIVEMVAERVQGMLDGGRYRAYVVVEERYRDLDDENYDDRLVLQDKMYGGIHLNNIQERLLDILKKLEVMLSYKSDPYKVTVSNLVRQGIVSMKFEIRKTDNRAGREAFYIPDKIYPSRLLKNPQNKDKWCFAWCLFVFFIRNQDNVPFPYHKWGYYNNDPNKIFTIKDTTNKFWERKNSMYQKYMRNNIIPYIYDVCKVTKEDIEWECEIDRVIENITLLEEDMKIKVFIWKYSFFENQRDENGNYEKWQIVLHRKPDYNYNTHSDYTCIDLLHVTEHEWNHELRNRNNRRSHYIIINNIDSMRATSIASNSIQRRLCRQCGLLISAKVNSTNRIIVSADDELNNHIENECKGNGTYELIFQQKLEFDKHFGVPKMFTKIKAMRKFPYVAYIDFESYQKEVTREKGENKSVELLYEQHPYQCGISLSCIEDEHWFKSELTNKGIDNYKIFTSSCSVDLVNSIIAYLAYVNFIIVKYIHKRVRFPYHNLSREKMKSYMKRSHKCTYCERSFKMIRRHKLEEYTIKKELSALKKAYKAATFSNEGSNDEDDLDYEDVSFEYEDLNDFSVDTSEDLSEDSSADAPSRTKSLFDLAKMNSAWSQEDDEEDDEEDDIPLDYEDDVPFSHEEYEDDAQEDIDENFEKLKANYKLKLIEHNHHTGKVVGVACYSCNNTLKWNNELIVYSHNGMRYDNKIILKYLDQEKVMSKIKEYSEECYKFYSKFANKTIIRDPLCKSSEQIMTFKIFNLRFQDSVLHTLCPLDRLIDSTIKNKSVGELKILFRKLIDYAISIGIENADDDEVFMKILTSKGYFPYDFARVTSEDEIDIVSKLRNQTEIPDMKYFDVRNSEAIQSEWELSRSKNLLDYSSFYCTKDVLLLEACFNNYRNIMFDFKFCGMDPAYFLTISSLSESIVLKMKRKYEIENEHCDLYYKRNKYTLTHEEILTYLKNKKAYFSPTDEELFDFIERGIRGGASSVLMKRKYDAQEEEGTHLMQLDINSLYPRVFLEPLPLFAIPKEHKGPHVHPTIYKKGVDFFQEDVHDLIKKILLSGNGEYQVSVDLYVPTDIQETIDYFEKYKYPQEYIDRAKEIQKIVVKDFNNNLHEYFRVLPPIISHKEIKYEDLSKYNQDILKINYLKNNKGVITPDESKVSKMVSGNNNKLIYTFEDQKDYVCFNVMFKQIVLRNFCIPTDLNKYVKYHCEPIMKDFCETLYQQRLNYKRFNDTMMEFCCKIILNSSFGKTCQSDIKRGNSGEFVSDQAKSMKLFASSEYAGSTILNENMVLVQRNKRKIKIKSVRHLGGYILDHSKCFLMEPIHTMRKIFRKNMETLYTDTDSCFIKLRNEDIDVMLKNEEINRYLDLTSFRKAPIPTKIDRDDELFQMNGGLKGLGLLAYEASYEKMIAIAAKQYSVKTLDNGYTFKSKGVTTNKKANPVIIDEDGNMVKFEEESEVMRMYDKILEDKSIKYNAAFPSMRSYELQVFNVMNNKLFLSGYNDKNLIDDNGIDCKYYGEKT